MYKVWLFWSCGDIPFFIWGLGGFFLQRIQRCRQKNNPSDFIRPLSSRVYSQDMPLPNHWWLSHFFMTSGLWKSWVVSMNNIWSFNIPPSPGGAQPPQVFDLFRQACSNSHNINPIKCWQKNLQHKILMPNCTKNHCCKSNPVYQHLNIIRIQPHSSRHFTLLYILIRDQETIMTTSTDYEAKLAS